MKKVLILAYDYPPYPSVGGIRPSVWVKYFREYGVEPIVVTRQWSSNQVSAMNYVLPGETTEVIVETNAFGKILKAPYKPSLSNKLLIRYGENRFGLLRKALTGLLEIFQYFLPVGTKRSIYQAADDFLKTEKVDVIIATADPFVLFHYANKLSKKHGIPWVADYRDPWSHYEERKGDFWFKFARNREKAIVQNAAHLISVSEMITDLVQELTGKKSSSVLPNGFDPELIEKSVHIEQNRETLTIAHAGTIYDWHPLEQFLKAVNEWRSNYSNFSVIFYGLNQIDRLEKCLTELPELRSHISWTERIPNEEMIEHLRKSNVTLMFNYYAYMGTKIFDYFAVNRLMLLCFTNDSEANRLKEQFYHLETKHEQRQLQAEAIQQNGGGICVENAEHLLLILQELQQQFEQNHYIQCATTNTEQYSRKYQVQQLAELIHKNF